jgi:nicotinamide mononucleotide transporter PnuC
MLKALWRDLASLTPLQQLWTAVFAGFSLVFSFIDFNQLLYPSQGASIFQWINDTDRGVALWKRVLYLFSGAASFTGVLSVVMAAKARISTFHWGILNCIFYGSYAFAYGYSGDAQLNIMFFLPLQFVGLWLWGKCAEIEARSVPRKLYPAVLIAAAAIWIALYYEIPPFSRAVSREQYVFADKKAPHILDSASTALSVVAQVLLLFRCWEQWVFWIVVDGKRMCAF